MIFLVILLLQDFSSVLTSPKSCQEEILRIGKKEDFESLKKLSVLYLCIGDIENAEKTLRKANNMKNDFVVKFNLGNIYLKKKEYDFAVFFLNQAKMLEDNELVYDKLSDAYYFMGDITSAEKVITEKIQKFDKGYLKRGFLRLEMGNLDGAEKDFLKQVRDEGGELGFLGLGEVYIRRGDKVKGKTFVERAVEISENAYILLWAGSYLHSAGFEEEATRYYQEAIGKIKDNRIKGTTLFLLATIQRDIGEYISSRENFNTAKEIYPELQTQKPEFSLKKRWELAERFFNNGNIKGAEKEFEEILRIWGTAETKKMLGKINFLKAMMFLEDEEKIKALDNSRKFLESYLEDVPADDEALYILSEVYLWIAEFGPIYKKGGNIIKAISVLQNALKIKKEPKYIETLGNAYFLLERYQDAVDTFSQCKDNPTCNTLLALSLIKIGDFKKAENIIKSKRMEEIDKLMLYEIKTKDPTSLEKIRKAIIYGEDIKEEKKEEEKEKEEKKEEKKKEEKRKKTQTQ